MRPTGAKSRIYRIQTLVLVCKEAEGFNVASDRRELWTAPFDAIAWVVLQ
ncbi:hypothetical protein [Xanthocytophaga agilis]|uniref:Uncharacterized protein n=1 Tax=Xanthocytophaga agilis TaxID=3048010 RepID=A0AAE3RAN1_9BACT|nr:hypothetical protein [Xanthocytophaga agilis]MDJ1506300.1 hypothetical protein [Xanthocytophaga agilis]